MFTIILHVFYTTLIAFVSLYAIYILWQIIAWLKLPAQEIKTTGFKTRVSIIIPARNEAASIGSCLHSLLQQDYPLHLLEIIVADDHSEDATKEITEHTLNNSRITWKYVPVKELLSNKKKALETGITESKGKLILITDADCTAGIRWVSSIVSAYEEHAYKMICGPVALTCEKTFCDKFQSLEVAGLSVLSGAGIKSGVPLLCNGANIAYTREAFESVNGFTGIDSLPTGDDTLLMFKINEHFPGQIGFLKTKGATINTHAQPTWKDCFQQRIRWGSKGLQSKNAMNTMVSLLVFVTNFLLLVGCIFSLVYISFSPVFLVCLIVKFTIDFLLLTCAIIFFNKRRLLVNFLLAEFVTMAYISWAGIAANYSHYTWKGRRY